MIDQEPIAAADKAGSEAAGRLLEQAVIDHVSDLHIQLDASAPSIRRRIDGVLYDDHSLPPPAATAAAKALKLMAGLDPAMQAKPQNGRFEATVAGRAMAFRISALPTIGGERVVVLLLRKDARPSFEFDQLGLNGQNLQAMLQLCHLPRGLVLVAAPSGHGTTTTTYAMLNHLNRPDRAIITVEDPVECTFKGISHVQVSPAAGLTFSAALNTVLRQAPNIVMASDVRDRETAWALVLLALTGHLVIAGMAVDGPLQAIQRMLDLGIQPYLLASSLRGIIAQRLIRRICPSCHTRDDLKHLDETTPTIHEYVHSHRDAAFSWGRGCDECGGAGYRGRIGVFEIATIDDALRQAILANDTPMIRQAFARSDRTDLVSDALEKAAQGITSLDEVTRLQAECLV